MPDPDRCHRLIGRFYEMPFHKMSDDLTAVSMPGWMDAKDIDLIKRALEHYAKVVHKEPAMTNQPD
jgi:hypothetical protein